MINNVRKTADPALRPPAKELADDQEMEQTSQRGKVKCSPWTQAVRLLLITTVYCAFIIIWTCFYTPLNKMSAVSWTRGVIRGLASRPRLGWCRHKTIRRYSIYPVSCYLLSYRLQLFAWRQELCQSLIMMSKNIDDLLRVHLLYCVPSSFISSI